MKKLITIILAGCMTLVLAGAVWAVEKQSISTDIIKLTDDSINLQYEKPLNNQTSWIAGGGIADYDNAWVDVTAIELYGGYRLYINDKLNYKAPNPLEGFFVQGMAGIAFVEAEWDSYWFGREHSEKQTTFMLGGLFGYKYQFEGGFMLEGGLGLNFASGDDWGGYESGTDFGLSLRAGYTW